MIVYPNAKINLGLRVLRRNADGYHDLETVFYPAGWSDILEITGSSAGHYRTADPERGSSSRCRRRPITA